MTNSGFKNFRESELKSKYADFNFSEILKNASNNDYWMDKQALWTVISGACNDAGKQFYIQMKEYIKNLCDIDTCNIHALRSMAQSVDAEHLVSFMKEDYPVELLKLINLFSIPRNHIFKRLHIDAVFPEVGAIDRRNISVKPTNYHLSLLVDTYTNIDNFVNLFTINAIPYGNEIRL